MAEDPKKPVEPPKKVEPEVADPDAPVNPPEDKGDDVGGNKGKNILEDKKEKTQKEETLEKIQTILAEYGGLESQIPLTSEYWNLLNVYRGL